MQTRRSVHHQSCADVRQFEQWLCASSSMTAVRGAYLQDHLPTGYFLSKHTHALEPQICARILSRFHFPRTRTSSFPSASFMERITEECRDLERKKSANKRSLS